jgi:hypothetical protein
VVALLPAQAVLPVGGLTLGRDGFQQSVLFFRFRFSWREVGDFDACPVISPVSGKQVSSVVYFHSERRKRWRPHWLWKKLNAGLSPVNDLSIEELADLFRRWRERGLTQ